MELIETYDKRIWRWWVMSDIISKSRDMIQIKSQKDDSGSEFCAHVHKDLLCFYSPYYTVAMKGNFSESSQELFTLELDCVQTQIFVEWLYTGRCDTDPWQQIDDSDMHTLYIFADKTDIIAFRRSIMTSIVALGRTPATPEEMANVVSVLPEDSGLRLYLLEEAVAEWRFNAEEVVVTEEDWKMRGYFPEDFSPEFWDQLVNGDHGSYLPSCIACDFHEHTDEEEWKMSKMTCATHFVSRRVMAPRAKCLKNPPTS